MGLTTKDKWRDNPYGTPKPRQKTWRGEDVRTFRKQVTATIAQGGRGRAWFGFGQKNSHTTPTPEPQPQATQEEIDDEEDEVEEGGGLHRTKLVLRHAMGALILLPLCIIISMSLWDQFVYHHFRWEILYSVPVWYAILGIALWYVLAFSGVVYASMLYLYVVGHELTHAISVFICGGTVRNFTVSLHGGHILASKDNLFIALTPYFVPFWSLVWLLITVPLYYVYPGIPMEATVCAGVGFWWGFHLYWTARIILKDQPDLKENGTFFSLALVYLNNLVVFLIMLRLFGALRLQSFLVDFRRNAVIFLNTVSDGVQWVISLFS